MARVVVKKVGYCEVWDVSVPDDVGPERVEDWVRANFETTPEKELEEADWAHYLIIDVEV